MSSEAFYKNLKAISTFHDVGLQSHYTPAPLDWHVVITDVVGSTKAIEAGKYKEVNMVGAASVASILNIAREIDIPFVFGGDGATFLVPDSLLPAVREALLATGRLSREVFGLELRMGIVSVGYLKEALGLGVLVSKFRLTPYFEQALFIGGGLTAAEKIIKGPDGSRYLIQGVSTIEPNLGGLTCRWNDIASVHGETISLLVRPLVSTPSETEKLCHDVVRKVEEYYGMDEMHHPVSFSGLRMSVGGLPLEREVRLRAGLRGPLGQLFYALWAGLKSLLFFLAARTGLSFGDLGQRAYLKLLIDTVEYKKFDDVLRLVISGTSEAREKLIRYLETERQRGALAYGIHVSDRALMTCLVFERYGKQVHFIDAADGGYTLAAKQLKAQLKEIEAVQE